MPPSIPQISLNLGFCAISITVGRLPVVALEDPLMGLEQWAFKLRLNQAGVCSKP